MTKAPKEAEMREKTKSSLFFQGGRGLALRLPNRSSLFFHTGIGVEVCFLAPKEVKLLRSGFGFSA